MGGGPAGSSVVTTAPTAGIGCVGRRYQKKLGAGGAVVGSAHEAAAGATPRRLAVASSMANGYAPTRSGAAGKRLCGNPNAVASRTLAIADALTFMPSRRGR